MKIIISPDKFKGSLSGLEICDAIEKGITKHKPDAKIVKLPLADGGDGTIEVLNHYLKGEMVTVRVHDPLFREIEASYLYSKSKRTAYIEMAAASGIRLLKTKEANPLLTSSFGTGELIADALGKGVRDIVLGVGGSATNDAGLGMCRALGFRFQDLNGHELEGRGGDLIRLSSVDDTAANPRLKNVKVRLACDVENPLFGPSGAAMTYAPQKGASPGETKKLDDGLRHLHQIIMDRYGVDLQKIKGAGAAGGMGAGCAFFLNAGLNPGIGMVKQIASFDKHLRGADWVISGEGRLDNQTLFGKVVKGVLDSLSTQKFAIFCGKSDLDAKQLRKLGVDYLSETIHYARNERDSMENAASYLEKSAEDFAKTCL